MLSPRDTLPSDGGASNTQPTTAGLHNTRASSQLFLGYSLPSEVPLTHRCTQQGEHKGCPRLRACLIHWGYPRKEAPSQSIAAQLRGFTPTSTAPPRYTLGQRHFAAGTAVTAACEFLLASSDNGAKRSSPMCCHT